MTIVGPFLQARHIPTNTILWRFKGNEELELGPIVGAKTAYVGGADGTVYGIDVRTGEQTWTGEASSRILSERHVGYPLTGMAIGRKTLIVPSEGTLVAFK
jgi:outer membrane protein assembly factor BamB